MTGVEARSRPPADTVTNTMLNIVLMNANSPKCVAVGDRDIDVAPARQRHAFHLLHRRQRISIEKEDKTPVAIRGHLQREIPPPSRYQTLCRLPFCGYTVDMGNRGAGIGARAPSSSRRDGMAD